MRIITALLIVTFLNASHAQSDEELIREQIQLFSQYMINGEMEKIVDCYTEDGKIMPARTAILEGKDLAEYWNPSQPRGSRTT